LEQRLGIPRYAIEQLLCLREIACETHPGVVHLSAGLRLPQSEVARYTAALHDRAETSASPNDAVSISRALRRIGGRLKPWGLLLNMLRRGDLPFWNSGTGVFARAAMISAADAKQLDELAFDEDNFPNFRFATQISQIDANDILNLDSLQLRPVLEAGELAFVPSGVALLTPRADVLDLASRSVAVAEIAERLSINSRSVPRFMLTNYPQVAKGSAGWHRAELKQAIPQFCWSPSGVEGLITQPSTLLQ
jgi:hypothetical protein